MNAIALLVTALILSAPSGAESALSEARVSSEELFEGPAGQLGGILVLPAGKGPFSAVVMIRGSGPSSRESYWADLFTSLLVGEGVAVLQMDKRGSDASHGDWRSATFDDLAADALAAVHHMRAKAEIRGDAIGLLGLSQGGKIAPIAASKDEAVAFVINVVGAATTLEEQVSWEMYHTFRESNLRGRDLQEALELQIMAERYVKGEIEWAGYERTLTAALERPWAAVARDFPSSKDSWRWTFFRGIIGFDPIPYWEKVRQPVLVIYGDDDHNAPSIRSTYRLLRTFIRTQHPDFTVLSIEDAGHPLFDPGSDPRRPRLHPVVLDVLPRWLAERRLSAVPREPETNP